ncbi:MAG TPA: hypothetical protein VK736_10765 [Candidatus Binatia bacterium]|nr:hypothetical protein [Candidatus Binatia bacterium]
MNDEDLIARYQERGVPTEWEQMAPPSMEPAFHLWYRALPSPSVDYNGAEKAEDLIKNPLKALREAGIIGQNDTPKISTMVVNHEKTLERFIMYAMVVVSTNPSTVGITLVKEEE